MKHFLFFLLAAPLLGFGQARILTRQEVLQDLHTLQLELMDRHPNIEVYTDKRTFNDFFTNIEVADSLLEHEAYALIATSNKIIQDGHTLFYPSKKLIAHNNTNEAFLPLQPFWDGTKLFVHKNYSKSTAFLEGDEIVSINGIKAEDLIQGMLLRMMRDGTNLTYPTWVLNTYFFEYYSYFHGCQEKYELELNSPAGNKSVTVDGISKDELLIQLRKQSNLDSKGISLQLYDHESIALLTIKDWHNDILRKYYKQRFIPEMRDIIEELENKKIERLIIDVRNNQGGDTRNSKYLLSYLLDEPFLLVEQYRKKRRGKIVNCGGPQSGLHQPMSVTYEGEVYVLINGGSFSNSGIFSSVLREHNRAIFIGEETGGSEFMICGNAKSVTLPNTKIQIDLPILQYEIKARNGRELRGIVPDFEIRPTIQDLISGTDVVLAFTLEMMNE